MKRVKYFHSTLSITSKNECITNNMMSYLITRDVWTKVRDIVRAWLEYKIKTTRGTTITVSAKKFFNWLGRYPYSSLEAQTFWSLVDELAPKLGLKPIFIREERRRVVYLIEDRVKF